MLLVLFFISAGLGTRLTSWFSAGKPLLLLSVLCVLLMICQNLIGMGVASVLGVRTELGVLSGSIAFAGGLGSAVAWGSEFAAKGVQNATEVAVIAATVGMTVGTFVGGPYVSWVIKTRKLAKPRGTEAAATGTSAAVVPLVDKQLIVVFLLFALAGVAGDWLRDGLRAYGVITPRFLTAMLAGIVISIIADVTRLPLARDVIERMWRRLPQPVHRHGLVWHRSQHARQDRRPDGVGTPPRRPSASCCSPTSWSSDRWGGTTRRRRRRAGSSDSG